jgi:hypothetical protein
MNATWPAAGGRGEPALPAELPDLAGDGQQRVGRRLVGQVVELGAGDLQPRAAPGDLPARDPQQQLMQPCQRCVPRRAGTGEHPDPLAR